MSRAEPIAETAPADRVARSGGKGPTLNDRYTAVAGDHFFTGTQALVRMVLDQMRADRRAGRNFAGFVSGYQGSPLAGIDREMHSRGKLLAENDIVFRPGLNEDLAATAVMGSQVSVTMPGATRDGILGIWYGKAPGLDRAADAIRHGMFAGASAGGVLALVGDDPAGKSSSLPSASESMLASLGLPILYPGNVDEILRLGHHGIALSRFSGLWASLKLVSAVADGSGSVRLTEPTADGVGVEGTGLGHVKPMLVPPYTLDSEGEIFGARQEAALEYARTHGLYGSWHEGDAWLGLVAAGDTYYGVVQALEWLGLRVEDLPSLGIRLLKPEMIYPLDSGVMRRFACGLSEIMVIEEKRAFIELHLKEALYGMADAPVVIGKRDDRGAPLVSEKGALDADALRRPLRERLAGRIDDGRLRPLPSGMVLELPVMPSGKATRTAYFCSGCPHSTSLQAPAGTLVGAGIGCHGMVTAFVDERHGDVVSMTQMGGEGAQWVGAEPFVAPTAFVQNMGDGTLAHSGSLAIRFAISAGSKITFKVLFNSAVAMTGGQRAVGGMTVATLSAELLSEGVRRIIVTTDDTGKYGRGDLPKGVEVWDRSRIDEAQTTLGAVDGVTVLIHDQECAAELRRKRKRGTATTPDHRLVINERVCEGCGDCSTKSNCLSLQPIDTEFGRKTAIHQSSCNFDFSCLQGDCPSFMKVRPPSRWSKRRVANRPAGAGAGAKDRSETTLDGQGLPEPQVIVPTDRVRIRMPGIGGTGVVTVAQMLAVAANIEGKHVLGLDQTGLAQKGGPVVSDMLLSITATDESANRPSAGDVDLYLALDLLVGVAPNHLKGASPERTIAIASTSATPTGTMLVDPDLKYPAIDEMRTVLDGHTRAKHNVWLDAMAITEQLFGSTATANTLLLGAAFQQGALPLRAESLERAIELNGTAVETNLQAFRWGRMAVHDPSRLMAVTSGRGSELSPSISSAHGKRVAALAAGTEELHEVLVSRIVDLTAYQNAAYAERYLERIESLAAAERRTTGGVAAQVTISAARGLYKLMAYKDEYEVARLLLDSATQTQADKVGGPGARVSWQLHPPMLRALGMQQKISIAMWWGRPTMRTLHAMRFVRGSALDPFGHAHVRREERRILREYEDSVDFAAKHLSQRTLAATAELLALPERVRGYEEVKLGNLEEYESRRKALERDIRGQSPRVDQPLSL
jgi:indolepyruvate ferredoxin oxidoreductase